MSRSHDPEFSDPRLAATYDVFDGDRSDLDHYEAIAFEFRARSVLDVGCGTRELGVRLAGIGLEVTGVDLAGASVDIARRKPGADAVAWVVGTLRFRSRAELDTSLDAAGVRDAPDRPGVEWVYVCRRR